MRSSNSHTGVLPALLLFALPFSAIAQNAADSVIHDRRPLFERVITVSGDSVDNLRMAQLLGNAPASGLMLRSASSLTGGHPGASGPRGFSVMLPRVTMITNSDLPFGQNDGALWAGKGYNFRVLGGVSASFGPVKLIAIPELVSSTNYRMSINPIDLRFARPLPPSRSQFSSPFNVVPYSIDWPYRFGDSAVRKLYPGQSSLTVALGAMEIGAATENEWWGPAIRNPILLSDNAPGFPHAFIRTGRPLVTPIGQFEGRWIVGGLHESDYFDNDITNDVRSLSAFGLTWKHRPTSNVTLGFARSVYSPTDGYGGVASHAFDFLKSTGHPNALPVGDSTMTPGPDQVYSFFAQWIVPVYGLESYVEWAHTESPRSLRDFLVQPNHTRGYTAGLNWAHPIGQSGTRVRLNGELTNVEQSSSYRFRPIGSFYTSRAVIQGYTNEGQMLGSGIGPGSSAQWISLDYLRSGFIIGANFGRTRVNNDAFFQKSNPHRCFHDVSVYPGLRGGFATRLFSLRADYSAITRLNAFWQRTRGCGSNESAIGDRTSHHLSITLSTLGW